MRARACRGDLEATRLGEGEGRVAGDHEVIEHRHVDERQRAPERAGEDLVGDRWLGHPGRMLMREDDARGMQFQRPPQDLARIDARLRQRASKGLFGADEMVLASRYKTMKTS